MCFIYSQVFCFKLNKPICDQYNHMTAVLGDAHQLFVVFVGVKKVVVHRKRFSGYCCQEPVINST